MTELQSLLAAIATLAASILMLVRVLPMTQSERLEYNWYLDEHQQKVGGRLTWRHRLAAWNGAKGGPAPKWHWIKPVQPLPREIVALRRIGL